MRVLHTADWHIGQLFYDQDRTEEHQAFLDWLLVTLEEHQVEVLLISGDIFDVPSPSTQSIRQFYTFLKEASQRMPHLHIIATAGNHDSAPRLEVPKPLLESSTIFLVGSPERTVEGEINFEKMLIPLRNRQGELRAYCLAVPYLRMGDYPSVEGAAQAYQAGVEAFYSAAAAYARERLEPHQALIGMGHLHAVEAQVSDLDQVERSIMGGLEGISAGAFDERFAYVALGHIHKAQAVGNREHIRYSGSPLPMSFSERNYRHQVVLLELEGAQLQQLTFLEIPVRIPLLRIPAFQFQPIDQVLEELNNLEPLEEGQEKPYLEVRVLLNGPEPSLRNQIDQALENKPVRLVKISVSYQSQTEPTSLGDLRVFHDPATLQPDELLRRAYQEEYGTELPQNLLDCFLEITHQINQPDQA